MVLGLLNHGIDALFGLHKENIQKFKKSMLDLGIQESDLVNPDLLEKWIKLSSQGPDKNEGQAMLTIETEAKRIVNEIAPKFKNNALEMIKFFSLAVEIDEYESFGRSKSDEKTYKLEAFNPSPPFYSFK